jgi:hypothetical protein
MDTLLLTWPEQWRDIAIIVYTAAGTLLFGVMLIFTIVIGLMTTATVLRTRRLLKDNVQPALENVQATTATVRTTVSFVSEYAISPVAKVYGTYAGARKFVSVISRFRGGGR